ncbi:MAG: glycosyltransferase family 39 protein [Patescibacteria group bacterium]
MSFLCVLNTLFFVALQAKSLSFLRIGLSNDFFYAGFLILIVLSVGAIAFFTKKFQWQREVRTFLLLFAPSLILLGYGLSQSNNFHYFFWLILGLSVILTGILFSLHFAKNERAYATEKEAPLSLISWIKKQGLVTLGLVAIFTLIFFGFGLNKLTKYAAVDEPLWLDGRINRYWANIEDQNWRKTNVSDKPGVTVAILTGPGLFFKPAKEFDDTKFEGPLFHASPNIESFYFAYRFPLLLAITLLLPLFYFFLEGLIGKKSALISYALIATSPVLIGISKIINPDSLLWIFTPLSLLSYLLYQKSDRFRYIVFSGIFLGLALLTKYVANIAIVYLIALIFLEYLYHPKITKQDVSLYIKRALGHLAFIVFFALTTFYCLMPAVWINPLQLLESTLMSQAFEKVAPLFLVLLGIIILDQWLNKTRFLKIILQFFSGWKQALALFFGTVFLGAILFTLGNTWSGMYFYDFMRLLSSPKNILLHSDYFGVFLTNFYPFVFAIIPVMLLGLIVSPFFFLRKNFYESQALRLSLYLLLFIFLYYIGSSINGVASTVRYQIMLFPVAAIISGIALTEGFSMLQKRFSLLHKVPFNVFVLLIGLSGFASLFLTPFPLSYASSLLPKAYSLDLKDMGPGSYEIAKILNSLPNAEKLKIWTDKDGVCKFFVGNCERGFDSYALHSYNYDYIVVSSVRKNRTTGMLRSKVEKDPTTIPIHTYYDRNDPAFAVYINGRSSHFVKAFAFPKKKD